MKLSMYKTLLAFAVLGTISSQAAMAADSGKVSLTSGFDYSSGNYGTSDTTDILYIPLTGTYETGPWTLKLTVPYLSITGSGNVTKDIGVYKSATASTRTTESGLGDVVAAATYNVFAGTGANPWLVDLTGKVKFATADETKGLGTGKNDYALQVDAYKVIDRFTAFGTVGYKVLGSPTGITLDNVLYGSLGGSYKYTEQTSSGLILDLRQKASPTGSEQRELTAYVSHKINKSWKSQAYVVKGFTDGSPDWGVGAMATYGF